MRRSFRLIFFFLAGWFLTACDTDSCGCVTMNLGIEVSIEDAAGNDLLNPATEGYFTKQDIDMFYEINGTLKTHAAMSSGQLDNPEGFTIVPDETQYVLNISSNPTAGGQVVTILRIKDRPEIRLITQVNGEHGRHVEKVWYNDQLVWPIPGIKTHPRVTVTLE